MRAARHPLIWSVTLAASLAAGAVARAQETARPTGVAPRNAVTLTGTVVADGTGNPLPYSTVRVDLLGKERFTDEKGVFKYFTVAPGAYKIRIRQLGFLPLDTTLVVEPGRESKPVFALMRVPTALAEVQVSAPVNVCEVPNAHGFVSDSALGSVLAEVRKNAERERLLRKAYPFEYRFVQTHDTYDLQSKSRVVRYDTVLHRSDAYWRYRRGKIVSDDRNRHFGEVRVMRLPTLADLADANFLQSHCFKYTGVVKKDSIPVHRIEFEPLDEVKSADVEGAIFLDSASYIIRRAEYKLTRGGAVKPPVLGLSVTTTYREVVPNIALFEEIRSVQPLVDERTGQKKAEFTHVQRLNTFRFLYDTPPGMVTVNRWVNLNKSPSANTLPGTRVKM